AFGLGDAHSRKHADPACRPAQSAWTAAQRVRRQRNRRTRLRPALLAGLAERVGGPETERAVDGGLRRPHGRARLRRGNGRRAPGAKPRLRRRKGAAAMTRMVVPLERPTRVCPLGLRFWDTVTRSAVDDRLTVEAYRPGHPQRRVRAFANRS